MILAIILPAMSYIAIYFITRYNRCKPNFTGKKCGQKDECGNYGKLCSVGQSCYNKQCHGSVTHPAGICYFDIDDTLTSSKGDPNELVQQCLDNNFAIGIITASGRRVTDVCDGDNPKSSWMPSLLCKQFNKNNSVMYNSKTEVAGSSIFPEHYPNNETHGFKKGFDMVYGKEKNYPNIPDKCVVLFDDSPCVIKDVKRYNPELETQCANKSCGLNSSLTADIVLQKVKSMQMNGCS